MRGSLSRWRALHLVAVIYLVAAFFLTPSLGLVQANAQAGAACPIGGPRTITGTSYTLRPDDQCAALVFTSLTPVAVTAPAANTVAPGFQAMLISTGGGLTVSSAGTGSTINGSLGTGGLTTAMIGGGQTGTLYGDGANYSWMVGAGFVTSPPTGAAFANLGGSSVFPGVLLGNSPVVQMPNGVLQITNPASIIPATRGDILRPCAGVTPAIGAVPGQTPAWWQVFDWLGQPRKIPLC